ncbi:MAG: hypothetical protein LRZ85_02130 [Alphaproteobacteria bacterium]|nr:hypothetical protein [Alphaproteobacteria bacterium]MCD8519840.1 hypothetical protein [Alphaproteobacteria bacterium]MCD8526482.1 hypothetical protein [Alphaproteobacteria bacterium]MCD8570377.1 hypothetical protein [Alphaproteobacteria bacterium]
MINLKSIKFINHQARQSQPERYLDVTVSAEAVISSYRTSLFSFEWLDAAGKIKDLAALPEKERPKRENVEKALKNGAALEKPVLGIGIQDNVEIGSGRAVFLTLAALGVKHIPVHIPVTHKDDFKTFIAALD